MKSILQLPVIRELHARSLLFPAAALVAVAGVLLHGALTRDSTQETAEQGPSEPASSPTPPPYRLDVDKAPLAYVSDYWLQLGERSRNNFVQIGRERHPGIVVAPGLAVSSLRAADDHWAEQWERKLATGLQAEEGTARQEAKPSSAPAADKKSAAKSPPSVPSKGKATAEPSYSLLGVDPDLGLAVFRLLMPYTATPFAPAEVSAMRAGANLTAISLTASGRLQVVPGILVSSPVSPGSDEPRASFEVAITWPDSLDAAAIVDLDGGLLGVGIRSGQGRRLVSADRVGQAVDRLRDGLPCRSIEVTALSTEVRRILGLDSGVLVEAVRAESFRPAPSLLSGDVLLEWSGEKVSSAEQFYRLYRRAEPGRLVPYLVLRSRQRLRGRTRLPGPDCRPVTEPPVRFARLGVVLRWGPRPADSGAENVEGWRVVGLLADGPAARGGLQRGDWIVAVQGRSFSRARASQPFEAYERRPQPLVLTVRRGDRVSLLAVTPQEPADLSAKLSSANPAQPAP